MINRINYNLRSILALLLLIGGAFLPALALADTAKDYSAQLGQARTKIVQTMADQKTKILDQADTQKKQLTDKRAATDEETKQARVKYDATMDKTYADLQKKASVPAEKQAVEKFNTDVRGAVNVRRDIVDTATNNYRQGFDNLMTAKVTNLTGAIDEYVASSTATIDQAQNDLAQGREVPVVKQYVKKNINAAEQKLKQVKNMSYDDNLKQLETDRSNTVSKADTDLTQTLNKSQQDLRSAFGGKL